jgi:hypothetical protein
MRALEDTSWNKKKPRSFAVIGSVLIRLSAYVVKLTSEIVQVFRIFSDIPVNSLGITKRETTSNSNQKHLPQQRCDA